MSQPIDLSSERQKPVFALFADFLCELWVKSFHLRFPGLLSKTTHLSAFTA
jgi:hypothetical protein